MRTARSECPPLLPRWPQADGGVAAVIATELSHPVGEPHGKHQPPHQTSHGRAPHQHCERIYPDPTTATSAQDQIAKGLPRTVYSTSHALPDQLRPNPATPHPTPARIQAGPDPQPAVAPTGRLPGRDDASHRLAASHHPGCFDRSAAERMHHRALNQRRRILHLPPHQLPPAATKGEKA
jgi:hypothetical protein